MNTRPISRPPSDDVEYETKAAPSARPETSRRKRNSARSAGAMQQIEKFIKRTGFNDREAESALGYSGGAIRHWRVEGVAPVVAGLAAECLERRLGAEQPDRLFVFKTSPVDAEAIVPLLKRFGIQVKEL